MRLIILIMLLVGCDHYEVVQVKPYPTSSLFASCNEVSCYLKVNEEKIDLSKYIEGRQNDNFNLSGKKEDFLRYLGEDRLGKKIYLISEYLADSCPVIYRFIALGKEKTLNFSDKFGNCNDYSEVSLSKVKGWVDFPKSENPNRKQLYTLYDIENNKIHKNPGAIFSICFEENRWSAKKQDDEYYQLGADSSCDGQKKWREKSKTHGHIILGRDQSKVLPNEKLYIHIDGFEPRSMPKNKKSKIITGLELAKTYEVKITYKDRVVKKLSLIHI